MDNYQKLFGESRPQKMEGGILNIHGSLLEGEFGAMRNVALGVKAHEQRDFKSAMHYVDLALAERPDNHHFLKIRANIKEELGDALGAIADFKRALYVSGEDCYATYHQIAVNFLNRKEFERALTAIDIAIGLKSKIDADDEINIPYIVDGVVYRIDSEKMYTNRANAKLNLKDYEGCALDCERAMEANSNYSNAFFIYGIVLLTVGHTENGFKALKIAEAKGSTQATQVLKQYFS